VNILLQILPYTTGTRYGADDGDPLFEKNFICFLGVGTGSYDIAIQWLQYAFNIELLISFGIIIILSTIIVIYSLTVKSTKTSHVYLAQRIRESWSIVILYPCAMMIAWVPGIIYAYHLNYLLNAGKKLPYHAYVTVDYLTTLNALYGPLLALIFYTRTLDARRAWMYNLRCILYVITYIDMDDRTSCSSIISIEDYQIAASRAQSGISLQLWGATSSSNKQTNSSAFDIQDQEVNPISSIIS
jgi:hypothetical protein